MTDQRNMDESAEAGDLEGHEDLKKSQAKCIIHYSQEDEHEKLLSPVNLDSWKSLLRAAEIRQHQPLLEIVKTLKEDEVPDIYYHRQCRNRFTMKRYLDSIIKAEQGGDGEEPSMKRRSIRGEHAESRVYPSNCIFCLKQNKYIKGTRTREALTKCAEFRADENIRQAAISKNDERMIALTSREMVAAEAQYHRSCYKDYTRQRKEPTTTRQATECESDDARYIAAESEAYDKMFDFIRNDLFQNPRVLKLSYLTNKLQSWIKSSGFEIIRDSTKKNIHRKIQHEFGDILHIIQIAPNKAIVFPSSISIRDLAEENQNLKEELETLKSDVSKQSAIIKKAASFIHSAIKEHQVQNPMTWPPDPAVLDAQHVVMPDLLKHFLQVVLTGEQSAVSTRVQWLILSLGQDIMYGASKGKLKTPKHILLPSAVKSLTGNVELIKILNRFGHCISYSQFSEIDTALCLQKLAMIPDTGVPLPQNIHAHVNTTLAFDNIDRLEETLSGSGTSHRVNGIAVQPKVQGPHFPPIVPQIRKGKQRSIEEFIDDFNVPVYNAGAKVGPPRRQKISEINYTEVRQEAWKKDMLWILCRMHSHENQSVAGWTGFNILSQDPEKVAENNIGYLPSINAPATNMSTVNEILGRSLKIMQQLELDGIICVFDQALYAKATEIKWKNMDKFNKIVLRMGAFHTTCNLLSIIGKRFQDAGLRDLCIETGIIAEGSVSAVLEGRMYNRGIRLHKLVYESLLRLAWQGFIPWIEHNHVNEKYIVEVTDELVSDLCDNMSHETCIETKEMPSYERLAQLFDEYLNTLRNDCGNLASFWMSYVDLVEIMLQLIRASRERDWSLHLSAIRAMIPWCFAYDRINYARYLPAYYADMVSLSTEHHNLNTYLKEGGFAVQVTSSGNPFAAIPVDQTVEETVNRDTQTPGGTKGFSLKPGAVHKYYLTAEYRTKFLGNLRDMVGLSSSEFHHDDLSKPRIAKDEAAVESVVDMLENNWINPFNENVKDLVSLSTGAAATNTIAKDLLRAKDVGETIYADFKQNRLEGNDQQQKFHDKMKKQTLQTFSNLKKKGKAVNIQGKEIILRADRNLFGNMIISAKSRKLDMQEVLSHPLGPIPWALAHPEGHPRKTNKAALGRSLVKNIPPAESIPKPQACIIDAMALVNKMNCDKKTFLSISDSVLSSVLKEGAGCKRIDVVFDVYREISIKNAERAARAGEEDTIIYKHIAPGTKITQWRNFLHSSVNKNNFIQFVVSQWQEDRCRCRLKDESVLLYVTCGEDCFKITANDVEEVHDLKSTQEEADTRMLLHAAHIAQFAYEAIIISSEDTDVRLLCLAFSSEITVPMYQKCSTDARTTFIDISKVAQALGLDVCKSLLGMHAFTGCDSISAFAGQGKLSALKIIKTNETFRKMFQEMSDDWNLSRELFTQIQAFTCLMYGCKNGTTDINLYRYQLFLAKKGEIDSFKLPPCADCLYKHSLRALYQTGIWKRSLICKPDIPSPVGFGWLLEQCDGGENITFDWMDGQPAPVAVMELLACKCRRSCKEPDCQCISNGLLCTDLCTLKTCSNQAPEEEEMLIDDIEDDDVEF